MIRGFALVLVALALVACRRNNPDVLLEYEGEVVPRSDFESYLHDLEVRGGPVNADVRAALRKTFTEERLLALEARRTGLTKPGATREEQDAAVKTLLANQAAALDITDGEILSYYAAHKDSFREPPTITIRQILVRTDREALDLRQKLTKPGTSFEALAREKSVAPEASQGGLMGAFRRGELPGELDAAAWPLPVGGLSGVVPSPLGFHILRLDARNDGRNLSLEEVRPAIRARVLTEKTEGKVRQFIEGLLARAKVNE